MKLKKIVALLFGAMLIQGCTGPSADADTAPEITTDTVSETETLTEAVREEGVFDFKTAADGIYFSNYKIDLPTVTNDIGRGFTLEYYSSGDMDDGSGKFDCADLKYESVYIATVFLVADDSKPLEEETIFGINFYDYSDEQRQFAARKVSVDGLKIGDAAEKLLQRYGDPDDTKTGSLGVINYVYETNGEGYLMAECRNDVITGILVMSEKTE